MTKTGLVRRIGIYATAAGAVGVLVGAVALVFAARGDDMPAYKEKLPPSRSSKKASKYKPRGKTVRKPDRDKKDRFSKRPGYTPPSAARTTSLKTATSVARPVPVKSPLTFNPKFSRDMKIGGASGLSPEEREQRRAERQKRQVENLKKRIESLTERIQKSKEDGSRSEHHIKRMEMSLDRMKNRLERLEKNLEGGPK